MKVLVRNAVYMPVLKWKQGEYTALGTLPSADQEHILPLVVVPPAGDFDPEAGQPLEPAEHIKRFGPRLFDHWGRRPIFVDALHVDDERHRSVSPEHPLAALLGRARTQGAQACPATSLQRSATYQAVVARFLQKHPDAPACLRISAVELEDTQLVDNIEAFLSEMKLSPERVVLLVDFEGDEAPPDDDFVEVLLERLNHLPHLHRWWLVALAMTSFPERLKLQVGECGRYPRSDWSIYERLLACGERLLRAPIFGDYALEYPDYRPVGRATPRARLRYSTKLEYLVENGTSTKKPHGYAAIHPVAEALVKKTDFAGAHYSNGDRFISQLATRTRKSGTAWQWRWATTEHHLRLVVGQLRTLLGVAEPARIPEPEPEPSLPL